MGASKYRAHLTFLFLLTSPQWLVSLTDQITQHGSSALPDESVSKPLVWIPWTGKGPQPLPIPKPYPDRQGGRGAGGRGAGGGGRGRARSGVGGGGGGRGSAGDRGECTCNCKCDCQTTQCNTRGGGDGGGGGGGWGGGREGGGPSGWGGGNGGSGGDGSFAGAGGPAICLPLPVNCEGNNKCYFGNGMSFDIGNTSNMPHLGGENGGRGFHAHNEEFTTQIMNVTDARHH